MKKQLKVIIVALVGTSLCLFGNVLAHAESDVIDSVDTNRVVTLLMDEGYTKGMIDSLGSDLLYEISAKLNDDEDDVDINCSSMEVDTLSELEELCCATDEELLEQGVEEKRIDEAREKVAEMYAMTNEELKEQYGLNEVEVEYFKEAVETGEAINQGDKKGKKKGALEISASGSISSNDLTYSQIVTSCPTKKKPVRHEVVISYEWRISTFWYIFDDVICVAWGGDLNLGTINAHSYYYTTDGRRRFLSYYNSAVMKEHEYVNRGVSFKIKQCAVTKNGPRLPLASYSPQNKSGVALFYIYQTKKEGKTSKVISQYGYQTLIGSANISVTKGIDIVLGSGYDKTSQHKTLIKY